MADTFRQLKIKTGSVRRLIKEYGAYVRELEQNERKLETLEDEYDRRRHMEHVAESRSMLPNTKKRLADATNDLNAFIQANAGDESLTAREEWTLAVEQVQEAWNSVLNVA
mmetsp:Transcript_8627/g.16899  ORF Transcript_8627/g.16899 Transcript_8627/m.16899 type:complete len:111 (-) Transcript_8627:26-358(-)